MMMIKIRMATIAERSINILLYHDDDDDDIVIKHDNNDDDDESTSFTATLTIRSTRLWYVQK